MSNLTGSALLAGTPDQHDASVPSPQTTETQAQVDKQIAGVDNKWYSNFEDPDARGFAELRNWESPEKVVASYRSLEQKLGTDMAIRGLIIPKDDSPQEEWNQVYDRLGRPTKPEEYSLKLPENADPEFAQSVTKWMHDAGLNNKQAAALTEKWSEFTAAKIEQENQKYVEQTHREVENLKIKWGADYNKNVELARRGQKILGWNDEDIEATERSKGTERMLNDLITVGKKFSEHTFVDSNGSTVTGNISKEAAAVELDRLKKDKAFITRLSQGGKKERDEFMRLSKIVKPVPRTNLLRENA